MVEVARDAEHELDADLRVAADHVGGHALWQWQLCEAATKVRAAHATPLSVSRNSQPILVQIS